MPANRNELMELLARANCTTPDECTERVCDSCTIEGRNSTAALEQAGLAIVPLEATGDMVKHGAFSVSAAIAAGNLLENEE